jgi:SPP1 gp7 family putative phage head morphogenesis protein
MSKKPPLSKDKMKWVKNRNVFLRGEKLNYNVSVEKRYKKELQEIIKKMTNESKLKILNLFRSKIGKEYFANDDSISSSARILMNELESKYNKFFSITSKSLAERMLESIKKISKTTLKASMKKLTGGLSLNTGIVSKGLKEISKATIAENVSLIKSIPEKYFKDITGSVMRSITTGEGLADLIPKFEKYEGISLRQAETLAHDQTSKAYSTINKIRLQNIGIKQFTWHHSNAGQKPRESHRKISGMIFSFDNLIEELIEAGVTNEADQGLPGWPIWCRCTMNPVINFEERLNE